MRWKGVTEMKLAFGLTRARFVFAVHNAYLLGWILKWSLDA